MSYQCYLQMLKCIQLYNGNLNDVFYAFFVKVSIFNKGYNADAGHCPGRNSIYIYMLYVANMPKSHIHISIT